VSDNRIVAYWETYLKTLSADLLVRDEQDMSEA
jgi:hypothetical protein